MIRFSHKASLVLERRFFKGFYHIWAWRPSWSMNGNHFSNFSFPCLREAPNEIWATLAQRLQRSHLKFSTFFSIQIYREANMTSPLKGQMSMYDHYFSYFGRPRIPDNLCKDSATRHPWFWKKIFKGFYHIWAWRPSWSMNGNHFSNFSFPCPREAPNEIWGTLVQRLQRSFEILSIFPIQMHMETNLFVCVEVLRPSQHNGVMSSVVSLPEHTFTGQA